MFYLHIISSICENYGGKEGKLSIDHQRVVDAIHASMHSDCTTVMDTTTTTTATPTDVVITHLHLTTAARALRPSVTEEV